MSCSLSPPPSPCFLWFSSVLSDCHKVAYNPNPSGTAALLSLSGHYIYWIYSSGGRERCAFAKLLQRVKQRYSSHLTKNCRWAFNKDISLWQLISLLTFECLISTQTQFKPLVRQSTKTPGKSFLILVLYCTHNCNQNFAECWSNEVFSLLGSCQNRTVTFAWL